MDLLETLKHEDSLVSIFLCLGRRSTKMYPFNIMPFRRIMVLVALYSTSPSEIIPLRAMLGTGHTTIYTDLRELEILGLVEKIESEERRLSCTGDFDKRYRAIAITEQGQQYVADWLQGV